MCVSSCRRTEDPGNRCIMNIHIGASVGTAARERNRRLGDDRSQVVLLHSLGHTHILLVAAGGENLSVCLLQATGGDAQQQGSSVTYMWRRCSEVNLSPSHFY